MAKQRMYQNAAEKQRAWNLKNPEAYAAILLRRDKTKLREAGRRWRAKNAAAQRERSSAWAKANPDAATANSAHRRARKLQATPSWANRFFIAEAYELAHRRTAIQGVKYVVDHIVPLKSDFVCGLHVEHNLQVIPENVNARKGNFFCPELGEALWLPK